ncbi:MAG: STAS domain-containing protein [Pseudomonadota bacterium]
MNISVEERDGHIVITMHEPRFDHALASRFRTRVMDIAKQNKPVVIDLTAVEFMDSSGLGAIVGLRKRLGWSVRIVLAGLRSPVFRVFELAKMTGVFSFFTSVDAALNRTGGDSERWETAPKQQAANG